MLSPANSPTAAFSHLPLGFTGSLDGEAESFLAAALGSKLVERNGVYVDDEAVRSTSSVGDEPTRHRLWDVSAGLVGVPPDG
ncbi:hypothetical protein [Haloprofundus salinisoli]|uniref:hypothetical protein n=1 Tax=Haloprofundus salinisoli TaxID=2876193 RepID=UPI001CCED06E|nr:hypothetical protein [Haloprofundus salinisoli]